MKRAGLKNDPSHVAHGAITFLSPQPAETRRVAFVHMYFAPRHESTSCEVLKISMTPCELDTFGRQLSAFLIEEMASGKTVAQSFGSGASSFDHLRFAYSKDGRNEGRVRAMNIKPSGGQFLRVGTKLGSLSRSFDMRSGSPPIHGHGTDPDGRFEGSRPERQKESSTV